MEDLVCPECNASISFASSLIVASCTLCGADLDLSSCEPVAVELAPAGEVRSRLMSGLYGAPVNACIADTPTSLRVDPWAT